jgi:hypothetical protein
MAEPKRHMDVPKERVLEDRFQTRLHPTSGPSVVPGHTQGPRIMRHMYLSCQLLRTIAP